ncbi:T9SS type A sorting domain-containing protein [Pseudopedobacter beijingensis]|uniref:T9SS type A sorting domain-containing protein n=1 Tax=Pseudopedobacter beijingensis TaxID=1207056 RepID=A0ABW4IE85_9SPHI
MKKILLFISLCFSMGLVEAQVSPLVAWQFSTPSATGKEVNGYISTLTDIGVEQSELTRGPGLVFSPAGYAKSYSSVSKTWSDLYLPLPIPAPDPLPATTRQQAYEFGDYFQITFKVKPGYAVSLSAIDLKLRGTAGGAKNYRWAYSLNNSTFTDIGTEDVVYSPVSTDGAVQAPVTLNTVSELQNLTSADNVIFRIYLWGNTSEGGANAIGRYNTATDLTPSLAIRGVVSHSNISNLLVWNFNKAKAGAATDGKEAFVNATSVNPNLNTSQLIRGTGISIPTTSFGSSINGSFPNWATPSTATFLTAQANEEYYEFEVSSNETDKFISLFNLNARVRRTGGGAPNYRWMYSVDDAEFIAIGSDLSVVPSDHGYALPTVELSAISALRNIPSSSKVRFRVYFWGATSAGGVTAMGGVSPYEATNNEFYNGLELRGMITDTPLPVSLISFTAKPQGATVNLNWSTASETENSHFDITRSADGKVFELMATEKGNGTTKNVSNYKFTDFYPLLGVNYYQLRQVDFNGKSSLSKIEAVNFSLDTRKFLAYTSENQVGVKLSVYTETAENVKVVISNMKGEEISKDSFKLIKGNNSFHLPAQLSSGIYVARLFSENGNLSAKFVKE